MAINFSLGRGSQPFESPDHSLQLVKIIRDEFLSLNHNPIVEDVDLLIVIGFLGLSNRDVGPEPLHLNFQGVALRAEGIGLVSELLYLSLQILDVGGGLGDLGLIISNNLLTLLNAEFEGSLSALLVSQLGLQTLDGRDGRAQLEPVVGDSIPLFLSLLSQDFNLFLVARNLGLVGTDLEVHVIELPIHIFQADDSI